MRRPAPLSNKSSSNNNFGDNNSIPRPGSLLKRPTPLSSKSYSNTFGDNNSIPRSSSLLKRPAPLSSKSCSNNFSNNNNTSIPRPGSLLSRRSSGRNNNIAEVENNNNSFSSAKNPSLLFRDIRLENEVNKKLQTSSSSSWNVNDDNLRPVPIFYPPFDPRCTCIITDESSTPSVVAIRISDCLKRRNISVEYNNDMITATCMTIDHVHFSINMYRGNNKNHRNTIIVEVVRIRGSTIAFHPHNRAILNCAMGKIINGGEETRNPLHTSPCEFPRFVASSRRSEMNDDDERQQEEDRSSSSSSSNKRRAKICTSLPTTAMERIWTLLKKDRIDVQRSGMKSLVALTDSFSSGVNLAIISSMAVLGIGNNDVGSSVENEIHQFIVRLIHRISPEEEEEEENIRTTTTTRDNDCLGEERGGKMIPKPPLLYVDDAYHGGWMRSMALRILSNALTTLSQHKSEYLSSILSTQQEGLLITKRDFIRALVKDLMIEEGTKTTRPPMEVVVACTTTNRLVSVHEATLATRCLYILAKNSSEVKAFLIGNPKASSSEENPTTLEILLKNFENNTRQHDILEEESQKAYEFLLAAS